MLRFGPMASSLHAVRLVRHPETPAAAVRSVAARVGRTRPGILTVTYVLEGDLARLRVPPPRTARMAARLWEHTCCEIFIACRGLPGYHEFNFSPSSEWTVYAFKRYRDGAPLAAPAANDLDPQIAVRRTAGQLELEAAIPLARLSWLHRTAALALALSTVVEDDNGSLSYWALNHPAGKPDFHHADGFALEIAGGDPAALAAL